MCTANWKKGKGIVDSCPFPCLNTGVRVFLQCLWFSESDHLGAGVLFAQTITGSAKNRLGTLGSQRTDQRWVQTQQKAPRTLIPSVAIQQNTMEDEPDCCVQLHHPDIQLRVTQSHLRISQMRLAPCLSLSVCLFSLFLVIKQKDIKQLQTKVFSQLGILSSHKVLLQTLTVTFSGSKNRARGSQCLFKWHRLFMGPSQKI